MIVLKDLIFSKYYSIDEIGNLPYGVQGVYALYNQQMKLMYIGKSSDMRPRIASHMCGNTHTKEVCHNFALFRFCEVPDIVDREIYETYYINRWKPLLNKDKTFTYNSEFYSPKYNALYEQRKEREEAAIDVSLQALRKHIKLI